MRKILELCWGVILRPLLTFEKIKEEKPLREALIFYLFAALLLLTIKPWNALLLIVQKGSYGHLIYLPLVYKFAILFGFFILSVCFINWVAIRLGSNSNLKPFFSGQLIIAGILNTLNAFMIIIPAFNKIDIIIPYGFVAIWATIMTYLLIYKVYNLSKLKSFSLLLILLISTYFSNYAVKFYYKYLSP